MPGARVLPAPLYRGVPYGLQIEDSALGNSATFIGYKLTDKAGLMSGGLLLQPVIFDSDTAIAGLGYPSAEEGWPPVAVATASPASGRAPLLVTFSGDKSSPGDGGDLVSYLWDFGDGSTPGEGPVVQHTYSNAGTYTATLTVANQGWSESSQHVVVTTTGKKG